MLEQGDIKKDGRGYCPEWFWTITSCCPEPLSNVFKCWLAMPLGAGFLSWVLARRTIEKKTESKTNFKGGYHYHDLLLAGRVPDNNFILMINVMTCSYFTLQINYTLQ